MKCVFPLFSGAQSLIRCSVFVFQEHVWLQGDAASDFSRSQTDKPDASLISSSLQLELCGGFKVSDGVRFDFFLLILQLNSLRVVYTRTGSTEPRGTRKILSHTRRKTFVGRHLNKSTLTSVSRPRSVAVRRVLILTRRFLVNFSVCCV